MKESKRILYISVHASSRPYILTYSQDPSVNIVTKLLKWLELVVKFSVLKLQRKI